MLGRNLLQSYGGRQGALVARCGSCQPQPERLRHRWATDRVLLPWLLLWAGSGWLQLPVLRLLLLLHHRGWGILLRRHCRQLQRGAAQVRGGQPPAAGGRRHP